MRFDKQGVTKIDQLFLYLNYIKYLFPWLFSTFYYSFLVEQEKELYDCFESELNSTNPKDRLKLMLQFSQYLGRFSSLGVPTDDIMNKLTQRANRELSNARRSISAVGKKQNSTLVAVQSSSNHVHSEKEGNDTTLLDHQLMNEMVECMSRKMDDVILYIKDQMVSNIYTVVRAQSKIMEDMTEMKEDVEEVKDNVTELTISRRLKKITPYLSFLFVGVFFLLLKEDLVDLFYTPDLVKDKLIEIKDYAINIIQEYCTWLTSSLQMKALWNLSNINTFVKKIVFSIIVFYCILKIVSSSLHSLIEYQVLCFVVPAFTLGFQYFIGSTQHFMLSIVIIFSYFIGKNILSSVKRGLFYVKCTCYILVFYFIYRIYVLVLALFDSLN